jgi:cell division protein FtsL
MRTATIFWLGLAGLLGAGLFHLKYDVQALERHLTGLNAEIVRNQESIHVLEAEWSYLSQPERLQKLAAKRLDLAAVTPAHIVTFGDLPERFEAAKPDDKPTTKTGKTR